MTSATAAPSSLRRSAASPGGLVVETVEERLSSLLSGSQFSVVSYLNLALEDISETEDEHALGQRLAELALQLQVQTSACHEDIGRISAELQAILPRCAADVGRLGVGLEGLRHDSQTLVEMTRVDNKNVEMSTSLETLSTLHALQANLTRTKEILTAAATWDATLSSVPPLLASQNLVEAVAALTLLEKGERALRGMPNPQERNEQITKIRQQITTMLQPQLQHAVSNMTSRLAPLQQCVQLYTQLGTLATLQDEYVKNRPSSIHKAWFDYAPSHNFVEWLPTWFDAVLSLLSEERRQSQAIFGSSLVPTMTKLVLKECFRPLKASFQSRLESVCSSKPGAVGDLETLCAAYEATLQFSSLAYDAVAGAWLDLVEAGVVVFADQHPSSTTSTTSGGGGGEATPMTAQKLYLDLCEIFVLVTSPFAAYQERLGDLEEAYSGKATAELAKEIQMIIRRGDGSSSSSEQQMGAPSLSLEGLASAIEELLHLSTRVYSVAEGALARFELLNGGYGATTSLSVINKLVAAHEDDLALAILTLNSMTSQHSTHLDESHVTCALQVLQIAGTVQRQAVDLTAKTRERMAVLSERMAAHIARDKKQSAAFVLPDALSPVEIDSIVTEAVCGNLLEETTSSFAVLNRLAGTTSSSLTGPSATAPSSAIVLYPEVQESIHRLSYACHNFVFDTCSAVPLRHLSSMSSMASWKADVRSSTEPSYGTLPQSYITQVGEHMLALVQALEPFASNPEALELANEVMSDVRNVALPPWKDFVKATGGMSTSDDVILHLMDGKALVDLVASSVVYEEEEMEDENEAAKASAAFCNAWLDVVGMAVTGRLLERIMRIPSLTQKGCEHLNADLNYLVNVLTALGVVGHPHPLLGHVAELATLDGDSLSERIAGRDPVMPLEAALAAMEERLAAIRGVAARYNY